MSDSVPTRVWYACYGSNLSRDRFMDYISSARDTTAPSEYVPWRLPYALYFSRSSTQWDGGSVAFITPTREEPVSLARAYLITFEQFTDVACRENGRKAGCTGLSIDLAAAKKHGHSRMLKTGWYSELIYLGERNGYPVLTFTSPEDLRGEDTRCPSPNYLRKIHSGLQEDHGFTVSESVSYLKDRPGIKGNIGEGELVGILGE